MLCSSAFRREGTKHFKLKYTRQVNKQDISPLLLSRSKPNTCSRFFEGWITLFIGNHFLVDSTEFSFNSFIWIAIYPLDIVIPLTFRRVAYFDKGFDSLFCLLYLHTGIMKTIQTCRTRRSCFITRYCLKFSQKFFIFPKRDQQLTVQNGGLRGKTYLK